MNSRRTFLGSLFSGTLGLLAGRSASARAEESLSSLPLPVCHETDICVLGGSATGVFAAVRAARLGARVAIVERANGFGGVAVNSLVNVWHPLYDTQFERKIIAGLTEETVARLQKRNAVDIYDKNRSVWAGFNSSELKLELDELVVESKIRPFLHTLFSEPYYESGNLTGVIVDGKSGRRVIKARVFIDATGDGDLCVR
ncbi:MAG: FAD-dependent oxidoreductase, partial [Thermoguttaceae bacterium]|nr:FAD-dependent oxidoreductase [Thermoguttaceae bacterium]